MSAHSSPSSARRQQAVEGSPRSPGWDEKVDEELTGVSTESIVSEAFFNIRNLRTNEVSFPVAFLQLLVQPA
eukprot:CAMPEP_0113904858 /NCGR_PEP_ID=MMETSP0780_2-20120614/23585_1 /TAXON_ID=652834 /ORGANISM="Palpitomonas bilix" /LENGTH=71 /DNA_ID=CAMNT_0000898713 /DNA_START=252 /DNA_END=463 /DNA_ORIENTATION=- /assembly_acc=CAM_ASM_000599